MSTTGDKIHVRCPVCEALLAVPAFAAGKTIKCPKCSGHVPVVDSQPAKPAKPAVAPATHSAAAAPAAVPPVIAAAAPARAEDGFAGAAAGTPSSGMPKFQATSSSAGTTNYGRSRKKSRGFGSSALAGVLMMGVAVTWFVGAFVFADRIFIYPPILFIIGIVTCIKGLANGNIVG